MKTQTLEEIIYNSRCFYYTTDLPIAVFENNKCLFKIPENLVLSHDILHDNNLIPIISHNVVDTQIIQNKLKEILIVLNLLESSYSIIVGPVLNEAIEEGTLTNLIRSNIIPFHQRTKMKEYFDSLNIINDKKLYYTSKTLENLFVNNKVNNIDYSSPMIQIENLNESYFAQKKEYRQDIFIHSPYAIEKEISDTISKGDTINAKRILKETNLVPHARLAKTVLRSYKNSMICSCSYMTRAAINGGVNPDDAFTLSDTYINIIEELSTIKELQDFEYTMAEGFSEKVNSINLHNYTDAVKKTIYYIDNHLCEDLNIDILAKQVYLNPCYLSDLFHKETNETISNWIQKTRIREAAQMIKNTNDNIADIAFFYHFCSQSYFVQCFKKIMGMTPGEYRKK